MAVAGAAAGPVGAVGAGTPPAMGHEVRNRRVGCCVLWSMAACAVPFNSTLRLLFTGDRQHGGQSPFMVFDCGTDIRLQGDEYDPLTGHGRQQQLDDFVQQVFRSQVCLHNVVCLVSE